jgi:hypothetical protein
VRPQQEGKSAPLVATCGRGYCSADMDHTCSKPRRRVIQGLRDWIELGQARSQRALAQDHFGPKILNYRRLHDNGPVADHVATLPRAHRFIKVKPTQTQHNALALVSIGVAGSHPTDAEELGRPGGSR